MIEKSKIKYKINNVLNKFKRTYLLDIANLGNIYIKWTLL